MDRPFDVHDQVAYDRLQSKLVPLWRSIQHLNTDSQTIVVVPSADIDDELSPSELQAYEERFLFLLFLLRQPRARMIFVTGQAIHPDIVDYYLDLMPGVIQSHARRRLFFLSPMEAAFRPLSVKILERPRLIEHIQSLIVDPDRAHLVPFMTTWADRELAMRLGIPMYGADPKDAVLGTKSAGRKLFREAGVKVPLGSEDIHTVDDIVDAVRKIRRERPDVAHVIIKHNEGVSGFGNATLDVSGLPSDENERSAIVQRIEGLALEPHAGTLDNYLTTLDRKGGVVEEMIDLQGIVSPSAQLRITPLGDVELLSTHDQILGGESGQVFFGSRFPADPGYAGLISASARKVAHKLADRSVIGRFAIDYVVGRDTNDDWTQYAIELNLRKGGTTHPFLTLQFLTDGEYDEQTGRYTAPSGREKFYVASDHIQDDLLRHLTPQDLLDIALMRGLHFDQSRQVGSVFHMLSALPVHGKVGVTSVGDSPEEAQERYNEVVDVLLEEARR